MDQLRGPSLWSTLVFGADMFTCSIFDPLAPQSLKFRHFFNAYKKASGSKMTIWPCLFPTPVNQTVTSFLQSESSRVKIWYHQIQFGIFTWNGSEWWSRKQIKMHQNKKNTFLVCSSLAPISFLRDSIRLSFVEIASRRFWTRAAVAVFSAFIRSKNCFDKNVRSLIGTH